MNIVEVLSELFLMLPKVDCAQLAPLWIAVLLSGLQTDYAPCLIQKFHADVEISCFWLSGAPDKLVEIYFFVRIVS